MEAAGTTKDYFGGILCSSDFSRIAKILKHTDKTTRCVIRSLTGRGLGPEGRRRREEEKMVD